jgi:soluble epoxide hydrolase / lipid-phosphate phosphatase
MAYETSPKLSKSVALSDGTTYAYVHSPPTALSNPTFLLLHGFPSSSYDWRRVIPGLTAQGYGVIAPDLLGYGGTDKPAEVTAYSFKRMADHLADIVRHEGLDQVIGVSHDWYVKDADSIPCF